MTLQIALLGKDGVLIASDTRVLKTKLSGIEPIQIYEHEDKVILNSPKTVAVAWSDNKPSGGFILAALDAFDSEWGKESSSLSKLCWNLWEKEKEKRQCEPIDCTLLIAKSKEKQIYKARFSRTDPMEIVAKPESLMRSGLVAGNDTNSACFFIHRYLPKELVATGRLAKWAAHYILMGGKINPHGVDGLSVHISKNGGVFKRLSERRLRQLESESNRLDGLISDVLFSKKYGGGLGQSGQRSKRITPPPAITQ